MNREIKFRAWVDNGSIKEMHYPNEIQMNSADAWGLWCKLGFENAYSEKHNIQEWQKNIEWMQYIGLKDKNGKEIYEGDIMCNDEYQTWEWRGVVKFSHGVFGAEWLSNVKSQSMVGSWGQKHNLRKLDDDIVERQIIIGNIYENPELLSGSS